MKFKVGDWVTMTQKGRKVYPRLGSYTGVVEETDNYTGGSIKIRRDGIVYRGEKAGHWWETAWWKKC